MLKMAPLTLSEVGLVVLPSSVLRDVPHRFLIRFSYRLLYQIMGEKKENRTLRFDSLQNIFVSIADFLRPNTCLHFSDVFLAK